LWKDITSIAASMPAPLCSSLNNSSSERELGRPARGVLPFPGGRKETPLPLIGASGNARGIEKTDLASGA